MKTFIKGSITMLVLIFFPACQQETDLIEPNETLEIIHHYEDGGQSFTIIFEVDNDYNVLNKKGDLERYESLLENIDEEKVLRVEDVSEDGWEIYFKIITSEEVHSQYRTEQNCTDWHSPNGTASYFLYRDTNYANEFTNLRQLNCSYFQDQWLDGANDQISSFQITSSGGQGALLAIFTDSCFYGWQFQFTTSVPNLHAVWVDWRNNPNLNPRNWGIGDLGDKISSLKGWSL